MRDESEYEGGAKAVKVTRTEERVMVNGKSRVIFVGTRGAKYLVNKGVPVPLAKAMKEKSAKKSAKK
jgi:hypothetical protein